MLFEQCRLNSADSKKRGQSPMTHSVHGVDSIDDSRITGRSGTLRPPSAVRHLVGYREIVRTAPYVQLPWHVREPREYLNNTL